MDQEDRTQEPSKRRRQEARERGQVAHSPELTGAAGFLGATAALAVRGDQLAEALVNLIRRPLIDPPTLSADAVEVVDRLRADALGVAAPVGLVLASFAVAALAAHLAQTSALFAPSLLAPDLGRLWAFGQGPGLVSRTTRGLWSVAKAAVVVAAAAWVVRGDWVAFRRLGDMPTPLVARAAGSALRHLGLTLGVAILALGGVDFWLQRRRFDLLLMLTPEEHREDLRSTEGDPALRARRRRLARLWQGGTEAETLRGATLVLTGPGGLTVVLAGGPPPRPVSVRSIVNGVQGQRLRDAAEEADVPSLAAPSLARKLASRRPPSLPPTPDLLAELAPLWERARI